MSAEADGGPVLAGNFARSSGASPTGKSFSSPLILTNRIIARHLIRWIRSCSQKPLRDGTRAFRTDSLLRIALNSNKMPTAVTQPASTARIASFWKKSNNLIRYGGAWSNVIITEAKGTAMWDINGKRILDFTSGQMSSLLGHGHPEIVEVVQAHIQNLDHLFSAMVTEPVVDLAQALVELLPPGLDRCMFLSTGSETNEAALKLAKMYTGGYEIVSLSASYRESSPAHTSSQLIVDGMTHGSGAATFSVGRKGYGPQLPGNFTLPVPYAYRSPFRNADGSYDWQAELNYGWDLIDRQSTGALAAVIIEPIVSTGGIITLPPGYLKEMKRHCEKRGMLLIIDEAQTGMGRTGDMFAFEHEGVVPDILTLSKTLGAGLPLGATICTEEIERVCHERGFFYYTTHLNDPLVCAVGAKVCEIVKRDNFVEQARVKGEVLKQGLLGVSAGLSSDLAPYSDIILKHSCKRSTRSSATCEAAAS